MARDSRIPKARARRPSHARRKAVSCGCATTQREFAAIKVWRYIENNLPLSDRESSFPHGLSHQIAQAKASQAADAGFQVAHHDGSTGFYLAEVEAQRVTVPSA